MSGTDGPALVAAAPDVIIELTFSVTYSAESLLAESYEVTEVTTLPADTENAICEPPAVAESVQSMVSELPPGLYTKT